MKYRLGLTSNCVLWEGLAQFVWETDCAKLLVPAYLLCQYIGEINPKIWSGVNFINVLQAPFLWADPESAKKPVKFLCFWDLCVHKNIDEIEP